MVFGRSDRATVLCCKEYGKGRVSGGQLAVGSKTNEGKHVPKITKRPRRVILFRHYENTYFEPTGIGVIWFCVRAELPAGGIELHRARRKGKCDERDYVEAG